MSQIRELQKLIQNTDFGIEILDIYCNGFELNFNTAVTKTKGLFFNDEKTLLHGIVSESNYREVLDIVENIYNDFKYRFYDVDGIVEELKHSYYI